MERAKEGSAGEISLWDNKTEPDPDVWKYILMLDYDTDNVNTNCVLQISFPPLACTTFLYHNPYFKPQMMYVPERKKKRNVWKLKFSKKGFRVNIFCYRRKKKSRCQDRKCNREHALGSCCRQNVEATVFGMSTWAVTANPSQNIYSCFDFLHFTAFKCSAAAELHNITIIHTVRWRWWQGGECIIHKEHLFNLNITQRAEDYMGWQTLKYQSSAFVRHYTWCKSSVSKYYLLCYNTLKTLIVKIDIVDSTGENWQHCI